ncbi:MAG: hypothetical protein ABI878_09525 [Acidobacteriota bacterium]
MHCEEQSYDAFEHLCENAFDDRRGVIALLTVYFDGASNVPKDESVPALHSVGAYIGTVDNWRKFRKEWRRELDKKNLEYFHMTDFEFAQSRAIAQKPIPSKSMFCDWQKDDFVPFLKKLHDTINRKDRKGEYRLESFTSTVIKKDFDETIPKDLIGDVQCSSYYIFNVVQILKAVHHFLSLSNNNDPIHYIFAGGDGWTLGESVCRYVERPNPSGKYFDLIKDTQSGDMRFNG